jgi:hypothetical protein
VEGPARKIPGVPEVVEVEFRAEREGAVDDVKEEDVEADVTADDVTDELEVPAFETGTVAEVASRAGGGGDGVVARSSARAAAERVVGPPDGGAEVSDDIKGGLVRKNQGLAPVKRTETLT